MSRITSGKIELRHKPVSLSSLVTGEVETNREALSQGALALSMNITLSDLVVYVDATRFTQIVSNVLNNSIQFTI